MLYKIGITGSRFYPLNKNNYIIELLNNYLISLMGNTLFILGGATGIDELVKNYCIKNNYDYIILKPKYYSNNDKLAPLKRNELIVENSDVIFAFPYKNSKGTLYTINYTKKLNKRINIFELD